MGELWQMARDWLNTLEVLAPDSPACAPQARVYDLALALQDGTVLCNALNKLIPGAIDSMNEKPEKQFLKMQNINGFLAACPKFGLKESDLFTADQLYYASDFQKVISSISKLSLSPTAKLKGLEGFPKAGGGATHTAADESGEDMYQSLEDLVGQSISFQEASAGQASAAFDPDDEEEEEDVYGSIRNAIDTETAEDVYSDLLYQNRGEEESIYTTVANPDDKRNCVLSELYETEKNYVGVLRTIIDKFMKSLESSKLSKADVQNLFSNITELYDLHEEFFRALETQMASKTGRNVSEPFATCTRKMRCYGQYCCEIPDAVKKLKELAANPKYGKILENAKKDSGQRFPLKDLLNVPMQRVLKYPLLIKELIKSTPESHPDKKRLIQTQQDVKELAEHINQTKKDYDALNNVIDSLKKYKGPNLRDIAPLVKDGDLKVKKEDSKEKLKDCYVFLFQSAVIFSYAKGVNFVFQKMIDLTADMEVADVPFWNLHKEEQTGKYTFAWSLKVKNVSHVFAAKSLATKKKWMTGMSNCIDILKDATGARPEVATRSADGGGAGADTASASSAPAKPSSASKSRKEKPAAHVAPAQPGKGKSSYEEWVPANASNKDEPVEDANPLRAGSSDEGWFGGKIQRGKAEKLLADAPDGTFLVRESQTRPGDYSLSVRYSNNVKHIKINRHGNKFDLAPDAKSFPTIQELVEHFQTHSLNRHFPGMETTLAIPFKDCVGRGMKGSMFGQEKPVGIGRARSRFAYVAKSHDELTFERGVEIVILSTQDQDPGWWKGQLPGGQIGIFPANYVQRL